jgi:hypothetical protein
MHEIRSDVGNKLIKKLYPNADFAVVYGYNDNHNCTSFSLRSTDKHADASAIAVKLGGGGHRNAAGCSAPGSHTMLPIVHYEMSFIYDTLQMAYKKNLYISDDPENWNSSNWNLPFMFLNTSQYSWVWAEYLGKKYNTNSCIYHVSGHDRYTLYFWINEKNMSVNQFHENMIKAQHYTPEEIVEVNFKVGANCNPPLPLYKIILAVFPEFV